MNLPNKLTMLRICMIPFFLVFMLIDTIPNNFLFAFIMFALASFTDLLDGKIARKYNLITTFGKFMDPLADKILVVSAMVAFVGLNITPSIVVIIILAREFLVTSFRLIAAGEGIVIAADKWGKYKTVSQMIWICYLLITQWIVNTFVLTNVDSIYLIGNILATIVVILTVFSGFNYIWKNKEILKDIK